MTALRSLFGSLYDTWVEKSDWTEQRQAMVDHQVAGRGIRSPRVLGAMRRVPRHLFVPEENRSRSYEDRALSIGYGQTISQPYIVAVMLEALDLTGREKVLEVGTGTGYEAALLAGLSRAVISVDLVPELIQETERNLETLKITNVQTYTTDGSEGLPERSPFDAILVAAAAPSIPEPLLRQMRPQGRLVIPIGDRKTQRLTLVQKSGSHLSTQDLGACSFVPLLGRHGWPAMPE